MTLVTTEISTGPPPFIVMAADRRLSSGTAAHSNRVKLLAVPGRPAGISYFGTAVVQMSSRWMWMDTWLRDFLSRNTTTTSLEATAESLASSLNGLSRMDRTQASGFQLAGFEGDGGPRFWYIRNIDDDGLPTLGGWQAREDYERRDHANTPAGAAVFYRNGDYRGHVAAWESLDESFGQMLSLQDFAASTSPADRLQLVRFKIDTIAAFYDQFARHSSVGRPVDAILIRSSGVEKWKRPRRAAALPPAHLR